MASSDEARRILALLSRPRKKGNSTTLAKQIIKGADKIASSEKSNGIRSPA